MSLPKIENLANRVAELEEKNAISVYYPSETSLTANTLTTIQLTKEKTKIGDRLTLHDGGILIGSGINYVRVSGQIYYYTVSNNTSTSVKNVYIYKNSTSYARGILNVPSNYNTVNTTEVIEVAEGDVIYLKGQSQSYDAVIGTGIAETCLTVEALG